MKYVLKLEGVSIGEYPTREEAETGIEMELSLGSTNPREDYTIEEEKLGVEVF